MPCQPDIVWIVCLCRRDETLKIIKYLDLEPAMPTLPLSI
jgi:hypothetical protein